MAITASTQLSGFSGFLTPEIAGPIFEKAYRTSVVQQLARRIPLGIAGVSVPVVTAKPTASWVNEAGQKQASNGTLSLKTMQPKKIAVLTAVSAEVLRANPGGYVDIFRDAVGEAIAIAFDQAVLHGTSTPFAGYLDQTTFASELGAHTAAEGGAWQDLNTALRLLVTAGKELTGFALDNVTEPTLNGSVDANGRPIFVDAPPAQDTASQASPASDAQQVRLGRLMGRPSAMARGVATTNLTTVVGYAGDWSQAVWGQIGGITFDVTTQATMTINGALTSLWENNLVGVRAETEFGFLLNDAQSFVRLTNTTGS